jgi:hypothetical protein
MPLVALGLMSFMQYSRIFQCFLITPKCRRRYGGSVDSGEAA